MGFIATLAPLLFGKPLLNDALTVDHAQLQNVLECSDPIVGLAGCFANMHRLPSCTEGILTGARVSREICALAVAAALFFRERGELELLFS